MIRKIKNRYVLVEASSPIRLDKPGIDELSTKLVSVLGELSFSYANPRVVTQYDANTFAIRATRSTEGHVILALAFINELAGSKVKLYTLRTSGTLAALMKSYKRLTATADQAKFISNSI
ncbi:MAG: hypothetical protein KGH72_00860 [Candidatus Micrarchaeota archaeon]|nr:hypothetical protein [Candidatus Micrarchaeota archaeon]